jgi:monoterpene epsilon-lactone hydrolase
MIKGEWAVLSEKAVLLHESMQRARDEDTHTGTVSLAEKRRYYDLRVAESASYPSEVTWLQESINGVPVLRVHGGRTSISNRVIQFLHGGGYSSGSVDGYRNFTGHLARAIGCDIVSVNYRLAPEHPFPAAISDSVDVYRGLLSTGILPEHIAIVGDSAGGGLALATVLKVRLDDLLQPAAVVAMSPWTDLEAQGDSVRRNAEIDLLARPDVLASLTEDYIGAKGDPRHPLASPLYGAYRGVCPIYLQVGGSEILLDDSTRVRDVAQRDGVDVLLDVFPEMQHVFQLYADKLPEADTAIEMIAEYLRTRLSL